MKIAITGKGGVGKSTLAGILAHLALRDGRSVVAVDADPDANLGSALGIPGDELARVTPISQQTELIEERTGARLKQFGQIFKLNPRVSDIIERFGYDHMGINLVVLGAIKAGGSGCACPENVFLRSLLSDIILQRDEFVLVDMEAGVEHLGRGTAQGVDRMVVVVEPTSSSIGTAHRIATLARQIGLDNLCYVANKVTNKEEEAFVNDQLGISKLIGVIPYSPKLRQASMEDISPFDRMDSRLEQAFKAIYSGLLG